MKRIPRSYSALYTVYDHVFVDVYRTGEDDTVTGIRVADGARESSDSVIIHPGGVEALSEFLVELVKEMKEAE